jgi:hypothetical protein
MIAGLPLPYAYARGRARLALRPDERHWRDWHAARGLAVLIDAVRSSPFADGISGIAPGAEADAVELALRVQLRARIAEVAAWAPDAWRPALLWTRRLIDLPLQAHLAAGGTEPEWMRDDPAAAQRGQTDAATPAAAVLLAPCRCRNAAVDARHTAALHPALRDWLERWRALWPPMSTDERSALEALTTTVAQHLTRFAAAAPEDAAALRSALHPRLLAFARLQAAEPVALFALLVLHALDLERLRGELLRRALFPAEART